MALAGLLAAQRATGKPLAEQKVLFLGAGEVSSLKGCGTSGGVSVYFLGSWRFTFSGFPCRTFSVRAAEIHGQKAPTA